jgi:hypothetical protein
MTIKFEEGRENGYLEYFAVSYLEKYKGKTHDELLWAEITPTDKKHPEHFKVIWEDDWQKPIYCTSLEEAKSVVLNNWSKHTPHNNGRVYDEDDRPGRDPYENFELGNLFTPRNV